MTDTLVDAAAPPQISLEAAGPLQIMIQTADKSYTLPTANLAEVPRVGDKVRIYAPPISLEPLTVEDRTWVFGMGAVQLILNCSG